jgi:bis(5'-nucleosyl)-tetraphosphatase (symmetrical)
MATYAIGDIHGCATTFEALLTRLPLDGERDRLWLTGDLVNRGPDNVRVLRRAMALHERMGERFQVILGNHDLHALARSANLVPAKRRDTLDDLLAAPDRGRFFEWLRHRPVAHRDGDRLLVHAGLVPDWDLDQVEELAREVERELQGPGGLGLTKAVLRPPERWREDLSSTERVLFTLSTLVRLRTLRADGTSCREFAGPPAEAPPGCLPWYDAPGRRSAGATVIFGHWAALGFHHQPGVWALDSACVWGQRLTAVRLDDGAVWQEPTREPGLGRYGD